MNTTMNTISQESIDSLNNFIANYERERDERIKREQDAYNEKINRLYREHEAWQPTFSQQLFEVVSTLFGATITTIHWIFKILLTLAILLSPAIFEAIINYFG